MNSTMMLSKQAKRTAALAAVVACAITLGGTLALAQHYAKPDGQYYLAQTYQYTPATGSQAQAGAAAARLGKTG